MTPRPPGPRVLGVAGSLRAASSNAALVRAVAALAGGGVVVFDGLGEIPLFSPDLAESDAVAEWRTALADADAVLVCTPEYAHGVPGALKNALDWTVSSGELYGKPVAAISASPSAEGGARALAGLRQTLAALGAVVPEAAAFAVPFVREALDGDRVADPALADRLRGALAALHPAPPTP